MFWSLKVCLAAAVAGVCATPTGVASPGGRAAPSPSAFVYGSVLEGLKEDGVPPALAKKLAGNPDFVGKCPLCTPTRLALEEYATLAAAPAAKVGRGLPDDLVRRLTSTDADVRRGALRDLVDRYVERGYVRSDLTADEKAALERELLKMRMVPKDPNAGLGNGMKFCPSCDGSCRIRPRTTP